MNPVANWWKVTCVGCGRDLTGRPALRVGKRADGTPISSYIGRPETSKERTFCSPCAKERVAALRQKTYRDTPPAHYEGAPEND